MTVHDKIFVRWNYLNASGVTSSTEVHFTHELDDSLTNFGAQMLFELTFEVSVLRSHIICHVGSVVDAFLTAIKLEPVKLKGFFPGLVFSMLFLT